MDTGIAHFGIDWIESVFTPVIVGLLGGRGGEAGGAGAESTLPHSPKNPTFACET